MSSHTTNRKLAAILFADIVGYTSLMQSNESLALHKIKRYQSLLDSSAQKFNGQVLKNYGDGSLMTFSNSVDAMKAAWQIQKQAKSDPSLSDPRLDVPLRIGIHVGEFVVENDDIYGNGVNLASRIESLGIQGAVLFSKNVYQKIKNQPEFEVKSLGQFAFKNVNEPMEVFALANEGFAVPKRDEMKGKLRTTTRTKSKWLISLLPALIIVIAGGFYYFNKNKSTAPAIIGAITIFPFDIKSGNPDIQYLGKGMVDLISTKLDGVPNLNPIDPNRVFNELEKTKVEVPALEKANMISNTLGATEFILGSIIEINDLLQISASKYNYEGELVAKNNIEGQKTQLASLIDELTRSLIADKIEKEGQEISSLATMTSDNLPALKAYLEGEQAYRKTEFGQAVEYFQTAVSLDSTFALAWLRLYSSRGWSGGTLGENFLEKAEQYGDKLPAKWQDLIRAQKMWETGLPGNETMIGNMLRKYGDDTELTNLMAEHIFHFYPIYGRSFTEAKPWLEKSRELDPKNMEALRHLADIAWTEGDTAALKNIKDQLPTESRQWLQNQVRLLSFMDTITEAQLEEVVAHPRYGLGAFYPREAIPENPNLLLELGLIFAPYTEINWIPMLLARMRGQDNEANTELKNRWKTNPQSGLRLIARAASIISSPGYLPYEEFYSLYLDSLTKYDEPQSYFASAKYAWALNQEELYKANKIKLANASYQSQGIINPARYYHWTLAAFEARQKGEYERAQISIDSAFSYCPSESYQWASEVAMDKIFIEADIYEEKQEFEKAIQRLENLPMWRNYHESIGYATYRLTQLYEKNGDIDKALAKSNLFLRNYKDCDEKYRPWWNEVEERQNRLIKMVN